MTEPRDQELDDYLAGKSEVSRLYQQLPAETPPPALDAKIRAAARRGLGPRRPRWMLPLSAAAVIMLSVGVLMQMQQEGVVPAAGDRSRESQGTVAEPFPMAPAAVEPAPRKTQQEDADESTWATRREKSEDLMSAPIASEQRAQPRQPQDWIEHIRHLRETGRNDETAAELEAFRKHYPDYVLPEDLR